MAQLVPQANSRRIAGQKSTMRDGSPVPLFIKSVLHSVVSFCSRLIISYQEQI